MAHNTIMRRVFTFIAILFLFSACSGAGEEWFGAAEEPPLPGKRVSVLAWGSQLKADPAHHELKVTIPPPKEHANWPSQGMAPVPHPALGEKLQNETTTSVGSAAQEYLRLTSSPVVAEGRVYTLDGEGVVEARKAQNIKTLHWQTTLPGPEVQEDLWGLGVAASTGRKEFLGGNLAYGEGVVVTTTAWGIIYALDAKTGEIQWQRNVKMPIKSAPVVAKETMFFITASNRTYALNSEDGTVRWTHDGVNETTSIFGAASPAVKDNIVVVPYSSGEVYALNADSGEPLWSGLLLGGSHRRATSVVLNDIDATPVIAYGRVYAVSHDGELIAFDLFGGQRLWTQDISSLHTPWVAGDFLYILTTENELVCIYTPEGKIKWVRSLPTATEESMFDLAGGSQTIRWSGPVMAGGNLLVAGSHGRMAVLSPFRGSINDAVPIISDVYLPPIVAGKHLYLLSNDAELMAIY